MPMTAEKTLPSANSSDRTPESQGLREQNHLISGKHSNITTKHSPYPSEMIRNYCSRDVGVPMFGAVYSFEQISASLRSTPNVKHLKTLGTPISEGTCEVHNLFNDPTDLYKAQLLHIRHS